MNSNIVANDDNDFSGPYRATKIWNTIIRAFKQSIPTGRRRRYMKVYDKAFTATEALEWMHRYLKSNPNFGSDVTKQQTVQLMGKLLKARIFEDVQGGKKKREFSEGSRVYRFNQSSPAKDARVPLSARMDLMNAAPGQKIVLTKNEKSKHTTKIKPQTIPKCHLVAKPLSLEAMEGVWKMVTLHRLQKTIGYNVLEEFLDASLVNGRHIMHNSLYVNKSGVVGNVNTKDQLPHWILSAMKCLVHWPNKVDDNFDVYPGFEKDVFRAVNEYFQGLTEPLLTHSLYETITNVFVMADSRYARHSSPLSAKYNAHSITSFGSIDDLLMNMTTTDNSHKFRNSNKSSCHRTLFSTVSSPSFSHLRGHSVGAINLSENKIKSESTGNIPLLRYETAFGPENKTITKVYYYPNQNSTTFSSSMFSRLPSVSNLGYQDAFKPGISNSPSRWQSERHLKCIDNQTLNILDTFKSKDISSRKSEDKSSLRGKSKSQTLPSQYTNEKHEKSKNSVQVGHQTRASRALSLTHSAVSSTYHEESQTSLHSTRPHSTSNIPNLSPVEGLDKFGRKINSVFSSVWPMSDEERVKQAVQLALLLIPPPNRRKLHLLLRFLSKIYHNSELQLTENSEDLRNLIVDTFYQTVLCSQDTIDMDTNLAKHFLWYLVENHDCVMQVPGDLRKQVEERLSEIQRVQVVYSSDDKGSTTYCKQIPLSLYEKESLQHSTDALRDLLKKIVADEKMSIKEKSKKLSEFQKLYPRIYENEFGLRNPMPAAPPTKVQRSLHLPRPLRRFRTLRS